MQCKGIFAARRWAEIIDRKNEKTLKQKTTKKLLKKGIKNNSLKTFM